MVLTKEESEKLKVLIDELTEKPSEVSTVETAVEEKPVEETTTV